MKVPRHAAPATLRRIALPSLVAVGLAGGPMRTAGEAQITPDPDTTTTPDSLPGFLLPPLIVTGTRAAMRTDRLPFAAAALTEAMLAQEPMPFAASALSRLPSVFIEEGAGVAGPTVLRLRGGDEPFTQVMFDGIPINLTGGFLDLQGLMLSNVERVEVTRGPQSAMYGSSAMAGAVQFLTRRGRPGPPRVSVAAEGGTSMRQGGQAHAELSVDGGSERVRYSAGAGTAYFRGIYEVPHDLTSWDLSGRLDAVVDDRVHLEATARYMDISSGLPVRDPGVSRAPLDPNQEDGRKRVLASAAARIAPASRWRHHLSAKVSRDDFTYRDRADGLDPADYPFFVFDFNFELNSVLRRAAVEYVGEIDVPAAGAPFTMAYGGKLEQEDLDVDQGGDFGDSASRFDRGNSAGFLEVQGRAGDLVNFLGGVRFERFEGLGVQVLPRGGVVVAVAGDALRARFGAGRAFKAPNLQQQFLENPFTVPNPGLDPETSVSWEAGLVTYSAAAGFTAQATYFHQRFENLIRLVPLDPSGTSQNQNLGESRVRGVEGQLGKTVGASWHVEVAATWLDSEMVDNTGLPDTLYPNGGRLLGLPGWTGNAVFTGRLLGGASASARVRLVGDQIVLTERFSGQRETVDAYLLLGMTVRVPLPGNGTAYVRVDNLLDTDYGTGFDRPGLPLTAVVGVRLSR